MRLVLLAVWVVITGLATLPAVIEAVDGSDGFTRLGPLFYGLLTLGLGWVLMYTYIKSLRADDIDDAE